MKITLKQRAGLEVAKVVFGALLLGITIGAASANGVATYLAGAAMGLFTIYILIKMYEIELDKLESEEKQSVTGKSWPTL